MTEHFQVLDLSHVLFGGLLENGAERFTCIILRVRAALAAASRTGLGVEEMVVRVSPSILFWRATPSRAGLRTLDAAHRTGICCVRS